ncbi:MAG TPA: YCF48-related protein, partial [Thermoleophilia bacterium]|nr:YCF48-related protein [Thermoleophilia bacterium]
DFQDCWFTDAEHGVVVGSGSTVIATSDGGATWQARAISPAAHLGGVCFADADNGWTVGSGGMVFATSDGGADWSLQRTGAVDYHGGLMLNGCSFVDGQCGWALGDGGVIVRTTDGGATWTSCGAAWLDQRTSGSNAYLWDCDFVDGLHGMAVGDGQTLMMTSDGGRAWAPVLPDTPVDQADLYDCDWADGDTLWAVGCSWNADVSAWDGLVWRSTDAGATWDRSTTGSDGPLGACSFPDSTHGWTADADGVIDVTTDGGQTWLQQALTTSDVQLCSVDFVSDSRGWCTTVDGRLWATTNGGKDWDVQYRRPEGMQGCEFIDARHGWLAADGIFATADGGHSWKRQSTLRPGSLRFLDADRGIAIGDSQTVGVVVTTDGGTTWQKASPPTDAQLLGCAFPTASRAYLVGVDGAILALDRQAPTSTVTSAPAWTNHSVAVALQARDAGAGLSVVCRRIDEAPAYANPSATLPITLGAPGDHSGDGLHTLEGWAIDRAGNRSPRVARTVGVDTRRPRTLAPSASRVTRGGVASLAFRVVDAAPNGGTAKVRILVKDRNGIVVRRVFATVKVNVLRTAHFVCHLAKGSYTFTVLATDRAGNHQAASGHSRLVVR